jgi:hypothetical protein
LNKLTIFREGDDQPKKSFLGLLSKSILSNFIENKNYGKAKIGILLQQLKDTLHNRKEEIEENAAIKIQYWVFFNNQFIHLFIV